MEKVSILGIDLAKNVFQLHGTDEKGHCILRKKVGRGQLYRIMANMPACTVFMEVCGGAHFLGRKFRENGHDVKLIAAHLVRPYVKGNKNDSTDAEAIVEAGTRPNMRFVTIKSSWHLDIQTIHRVRSRLVGNRTALCNEIRAILFENGIIIAPGVSRLRKRLSELTTTDFDRVSTIAKQTVMELGSELDGIQQRIESCEERLALLAQDNDACRRLQSIRGIGLLTATALIAATPDPSAFKNGRHYSASLGLVPRHTGTGGKNTLHGISKRGNPYLRRLLIGGARAALLHASKHPDRLGRWAQKVHEARGYNKATVALANKNARIAWAILAKGGEYQAAA